MSVRSFGPLDLRALQEPALERVGRGFNLLGLDYCSLGHEMDPSGQEEGMVPLAVRRVERFLIFEEPVADRSPNGRETDLCIAAGG